MKTKTQKKQYNNNSNYFRDWTTEKLKEEAIGYYESIYGIECYGVGDLIIYSGILKELEKRGIQPKEKLTF